jgi:Uma2 family endonuclease
VAHPAPLSPILYEEYRLLPEDGRRYELIEGDLLVSPAPSSRHQTVSRRLQFELMKALEEAGLAQVFDAPIDVVLEETTCVQPDLVVVSAANAHLITERAIEGVPDVLVEILSPTSLDRDQHLKRKLYQRFAVPEYWVVDPEHGMMVVHRFNGEVYGIRARYDRASTLECPDFPTLAVPLAHVFRA